MLEEKVQSAIESQLTTLAKENKLMKAENVTLERKYGQFFYPDLVTSYRVIEIKRGDKWSQGLGQVLRDCWVANLIPSKSCLHRWVYRPKDVGRGSTEQNTLTVKTLKKTPKIPWLVLFDLPIEHRELVKEVCANAEVGLTVFSYGQSCFDEPETFFKPEIDLHKQIMTRHYLGGLMPTETTIAFN